MTYPKANWFGWPGDGFSIDEENFS